MSTSLSRRPVTTRRLAGSLLIVLAGGLAANSLLGPLVLDVIRYRFSASLVYQGIGLDFVSLVLVAPLALGAGVLLLRERPLGPALGLGVGAYTAYMAIQYVVGPEYLELPGNNERFFLLHLSLLVLGVAVTAGAWTLLDERRVPPGSGRAARRWGGLLVALAALLVVRYLPAMIELTAGVPALPEFRENSTSFLLIASLDLGLLAPAALAAGAGLWSGRASGVKGLHLVVGWIALVGLAVGAMAVTSWYHDEPTASVGRTVTFVLAGVALAGVYARLEGPLLRSSSVAVSDREA